jgi:hypothetical protein
MGLRADISTNSNHGAVFSEDVLKVEVHGPSEDYLTIIDVPGIFRTTTQGTTKNDMELVRDLVKGYIREDRTIVLAVLPSNVDIATQEILELAEEYDPNGVRTLGVLTKPDLVLEPGAQKAVCDLVRGKTRPLALGYYLVRNRGAQGGLVEQSSLDPIFQREPWIDLPRDRVGLPALRTQLGALLVEISRREFPKLCRDVSDQINECKKDLDDLGPPRQDEREQRRFLSHIAGAFQDRARAALAADYNVDEVFQKQPELRLITHVVNITDVFTADCQRGAHSRRFENTGTSAAPAVKVVGRPVSAGEDDLGVRMLADLRQLLQTAKVDNATPEERGELRDVLFCPGKTATGMPQGDVTAWIEEVYLGSRGMDLGTFNQHLISMAFAEQSRKWGPMTKVYMSRIIITLHRFIGTALRSVCKDEQAHKHLWSALLDSLLERYKAAVKQAALLVDIEQHKKPYTLNRQFARDLSKARGQRLTELLRARARKDITQYGETQFMVNLDDIAAAAEGKANAQQLQEEIHDILRAYYSVALDRFIDNVFQLAVDYELLHGPSSPLNVFTQDWVINLEPEQLELIAGEAKANKKRRAKLAKKIEDLKIALKILRT